MTVFLCLLFILCLSYTTSFQNHHKIYQLVSWSPGKLSSHPLYSQKPRRNQGSITPRRKPQPTRKKFDSPRHEIAQGKVSRLLTDALTDIICGGKVRTTTMPDSFLLSSLSIDEIELNSDFSIADIYVSCYGNAVERREVYVWLCHNVDRIQYLLTQRLRFLRRVPDVVFQLVDYQEEAFMDQAFDEISKESSEEDDDAPAWPSIEYEEVE
eukprot:gene9371-10174_t